MSAGWEAIDRLQESEALGPHAGRRLGPILTWEAAALRQGGRSKQKQVPHDAVSSCLVRILSITQLLVRQQNRVSSGLIHTLSTP